MRNTGVLILTKMGTIRRHLVFTLCRGFFTGPARHCDDS